MIDGAPWAELLVGLGRASPPEAMALTMAIDPADGAMTLSLRIAATARINLSANIAITPAEARRIGHGLARIADQVAAEQPGAGERTDLVISSAEPLSADDVRWFKRVMEETGGAALVALVALIRSLMRAEPPGAVAHG
ncbi:MAG TPA: hypothetical protein VGG29_20805 [Caulobacteraceae bacterium]|jgi:hypothetical protein